MVDEPRQATPTAGSYYWDVELRPLEISTIPKTRCSGPSRVPNPIWPWPLVWRRNGDRQAVRVILEPLPAKIDSRAVRPHDVDARDDSPRRTRAGSPVPEWSRTSAVWALTMGTSVGTCRQWSVNWRPASRNCCLPEDFGACRPL
jgi:hypothetical protein